MTLNDLLVVVWYCVECSVSAFKRCIYVGYLKFANGV